MVHERDAGCESGAVGTALTLQLRRYPLCHPTSHPAPPPPVPASSSSSSPSHPHPLTPLTRHPPSAGFLIQLISLLVPALAYLKGERVTSRTWLCCVGALGGALLISFDHAGLGGAAHGAASVAAGSLTGDAMVVAACAFYAMATGEGVCCVRVWCDVYFDCVLHRTKKHPSPLTPTYHTPTSPHTPPPSPSPPQSACPATPAASTPHASPRPATTPS